MPNSNDSIDTASRFLASTLHEIRTPIQTVISTIELLQDTSLDKEQTEYVRQIQFSAEVLLELANDILDFTKIRSHEFKLESIPFDIAGLTEQVVDLICIEAFNRGLEIVTDIDYSLPALVTGDPVRVQQIILNLVKNAVKFTQQGYIHVCLTKQKDNSLLLEVIDSGIGVSPDKQKLIFNDYYQADSSISRKYGGTGLGLSICKNLVAVMHGKIGVKSNPYGGSIFWFSLPLPAVVSPPSETQPLVAPANTRILLVDDNVLAVNSLMRKLNGLGLTDIETANTGEEAITHLEFAAKIGKPFTMAFIDMIMPVMDGWRLAADINSNQLINSIKLFLVVPEGQMGGEAKMKMLDWFNGYLYKPVKRQKLVELLNEAFTEPMDLESVDEENTSLRKQDESSITVNKSLEPAPETEQTNAQKLAELDAHLADGFKILVAEDHPVNRKLMETFLEKFGADVFLANDGEEAIQQIAAHPEISLIFMDIQMPVKNGIDATVELRTKKYDGIIVACTANNDPDDFEAYRKIGINDILVKPFKRVAIKNVLEKWSTVMMFPAVKEIAVLENAQMNGLMHWDKNDFMDTTGGDTKLGMQLISEYCAQTSELLAQAEQAASKKDFNELRKIGHTIKGSSGAVSAQVIAEYGDRLNKAAKAEDAAAAETLLIELNESYIKFHQEIDAWKKTL